MVYVRKTDLDNVLKCVRTFKAYYLREDILLEALLESKANTTSSLISECYNRVLHDDNAKKSTITALGTLLYNISKNSPVIKCDVWSGTNKRYTVDKESIGDILEYKAGIYREKNRKFCRIFEGANGDADNHVGIFLNYLRGIAQDIPRSPKGRPLNVEEVLLKTGIEKDAVFGAFKTASEIDGLGPFMRFNEYYGFYALEKNSLANIEEFMDYLDAKKEYECLKDKYALAFGNERTAEIDEILQDAYKTYVRAITANHGEWKSGTENKKANQRVSDMFEGFFSGFAKGMLTDESKLQEVFGDIIAVSPNSKNGGRIKIDKRKLLSTARYMMYYNTAPTE